MPMKLVIGTAVLLVWNTSTYSQTTRPPPEPYSCQMYREAEKKCAANTIGKCYVQAEMERLRQQCLREGGRL
jgi:hypothetical protein